MVNKFVKFNFPLEMSRAPSGQKTYFSPISLHAFQTESPPTWLNAFQIRKNFSC